MRILLRMTHAARMSHQHAATVCQLLKRAAGELRLEADFPPGVVFDAVEVGRMSLEKDSTYAFGLTFWDPADDACRARCEQLVEALHRLGTSGPVRDSGLGGNYRVERCHSLVEPDAVSPVAIPAEWLEAQVRAAQAQEFLTLRWLTPLCAHLPGKQGFFDADTFLVDELLDRLVGRLKKACHLDLDPPALHGSDVKIVEPPGLARLHWIKWQYGEQASAHPGGDGSSGRDARHGRKTDQLSGQLYGVMGRIAIRLRQPEWIRPLVLGQYACVGEKTNFGLGRYAIEETQACLPPGVPRYLRAPRAEPLARLAMAGPAMRHEAERLDVPLEDVRRLADQVCGGTFHPQPAARFLLPDSKPRVISVPSRPERVLQRAVHELLAPVLDRFLSDSCIAYRRGLGRRDAARRIQEAFREGWRWALKADFHQFFDSVDHALLRDRLEVFVQDDDLVGLLMQWVEAGAPQPGRGLPTGAVVSPLLANLFLQSFDEAVRRDGGRLVRYADDFVLLFRDPAAGHKVLERAAELAERLRLHLNDEKTKLLELETTPFDFLGFRFFSEQGWQFHGGGLVQVEDLGWHEAPKQRDVAARRTLPGEQGLEPSRSGTWIVGPQVDWIGIDGSDVVCRSRSQGTEDRFPRRRVRELIALGPATVDHSLFRHRDEDPIQLLIADDSGRWTCAVCEPPPLELAELVKVQVAVAGDPQRSLGIARRLIAAKLANHATLALAYPPRGGPGTLAQRLRELAADAARAEDPQQLLGIEGSGAALWYGEFAQRIDRRYRFEHRVHPAASDPVNVMLNIGQTLLHRLICLTLIREGFAPSIGFFHQPSWRHAALASDLQEVFRHLVDRAVIEATGVIAPGEFHETDRGPFSLHIEPGAYRTLVASVFKMLATRCVAQHQEAARPYRLHIASLARSLHRHLLNPAAEIKIFEYVT
jgi:CRISPR-associated protein Cas1